MSLEIYWKRHHPPNGQGDPISNTTSSISEFAGLE